MTSIVEQDLQTRAHDYLSNLTTDHYYIHYEARNHLQSVAELQKIFGSHLGDSHAKLILATNGFFDADNLAFIQQNNIEIWGNLQPANMPAGIKYWLLPAMTNTLDPATFPEHAGQARLLQLPAGNSIIEVNYLASSASISLFDHTGEPLEMQTSFFYGYSEEGALGSLPIGINCQHAESIYADVDTENAWALDLSPADSPHQTINARGHGAAVLSLTLTAGNYMVHFSCQAKPDDSAEFDDNHNLYHYGSGPTDLTQIFHLNEDEAGERALRLKLSCDWQFSIRPATPSEVAAL